MPGITDEDWFTSNVGAYDTRMDSLLGDVYDFSTIIVPDVVFRPKRYKHLRVSVPASRCLPEWKGDTAKQVYPDLPDSDRHARHEYLKGIDTRAFLSQTSPCHSPPQIHV